MCSVTTTWATIHTDSTAGITATTLTAITMPMATAAGITDIRVGETTAMPDHILEA